jgi:hypothetical protein
MKKRKKKRKTGFCLWPLYIKKKNLWLLIFVKHYDCLVITLNVQSTFSFMIFRTTHSRVYIYEGVLYICCTLCVQESLPIYIYHITYQRVLVNYFFFAFKRVCMCSWIRLLCSTKKYGIYMLWKNNGWDANSLSFFFFFFFLSLLEQLKVDNIVSLEASCYK